MKSVVICPDPVLKTQFEQALIARGDFVTAKFLGEYPKPDALKRLLRIWMPDMVFTTIQDNSAFAGLAKVLEEFPTVFKIGIGTQDDPAALRAALRFRMTEFLVPPFEYGSLNTVLADIRRERELHPVSSECQNHFCTFLPAKGGVGTSTVAANVAAAFAEIPDTNVLLADFDVHSGIVGFLFNVEHEFNLCDAADRGGTLDDETWSRLIRKSGNIDLLLSSGPSTALEHALRDTGVTQIVDFAHRNYSVVCADLADSLDDRALGILRESTRIFLVTTPELASLRLARLKAMALQKLDWAEKSFLVVNRITKSMDLSLEEIEKTVGLPVFASFPSEYANVEQAARTGSPAPKLSTGARQFAHKVMNRKFEPKRARFIERFALVPARYAFH